MKYREGYRIQGTGYRVQGTGYRAQSTEHRVQSTEYRYMDIHMRPFFAGSTGAVVPSAITAGKGIEKQRTKSPESPASPDLLFHRSDDYDFCFGRDVAMWPCGDDESLRVLL